MITGDFRGSRHGNVPAPSFIFGLANPNSTGAERMQVPDEVRKCVVFLTYRTANEHRFGGTAFLVAVRLKVPVESYVVYAVTARHVIEAIKDRSVDGKVYIRGNVSSGGVREFPTSFDEWQFHEKVPIDVAAYSVSNPGDLDCKQIPVEYFATQHNVLTEGIGIGSETFVTGLFTQHHGRSRNIPILRAGNIAAMPEEPVKTKLGLMPAYLIECSSIGGLSGSPVYVYLEPLRRLTSGRIIQEEVYSVGKFWLLGLMHGHWNFPMEGDAPIESGVFDDEKLNVGIGVVVPSDFILEVLDCERFASERMSYEDGVNNPKRPAAE